MCHSLLNISLAPSLGEIEIEKKTQGGSPLFTYISCKMATFKGKWLDKYSIHGASGISTPKTCNTLPETNSQFAPGNGWLEDYFSLGEGLFACG